MYFILKCTLHIVYMLYSNQLCNISNSHVLPPNHVNKNAAKRGQEMHTPNFLFQHQSLFPTNLNSEGGT